MCNLAVVRFVERVLPAICISGKRIIEVGSLNTPHLCEVLTTLKPAVYLGVDIVPGSNVDEVCSAEELISRYGEGAFDVLISTEVLEHVRDWRLVINNFKGVVRPNGHIVITTRSYGFGLHAFPFDFWRWEIEDMYAVFKDFNVLAVEKDPISPGVFLYAERPSNWQPLLLEQYAVYSTVRFCRITEVPEAIRPSGLLWLLRRGYYVYCCQGLYALLWKAVRAMCRTLLLKRNTAIG